MASEPSLFAHVARRLALWRLLRTSLPARLTAAFLSLSVAILLLASYVSYRSAEAALRERVVEHLTALADADASELNSWIERQRAALEFAAQLPGVHEAAAEAGRTPGAPIRADRAGASAFTRMLGAAQPRVLAALEVQLLRVPGGMVVASTDRARIGSFAVDQLYYQEGRNATYTQHVYPSGITGRPTLSIATPVHDGHGRSHAVLAAHLDLQEMERVLAKRPSLVSIETYLVNRYAEFVSSTRFGREEHRRGVHSQGIDRALAGESGSGLYPDYLGRPVIGVWRWLPEHQLALVLESSQAEAFAPARRLLWNALLIGALAVALLTLGVVVIARRATRPVLAMAAAAERVAGGDLSAAAPVESEDEVGELGRSFNAMTHQLQSVYGELHSQVSATRFALAEAQASRALLRDVVDNTTAIIGVVGLDGRIRLANNRFESALGLARDTAVGRRLAEAWQGGSADVLLSALDLAQQRNAVVEREIELTTDAESHTWQALCFPLRDSGGASYALGIVATDLTERARAEEERRHRDAKVQQAQKLESLGIMAGGIAHDFNNILGAVLGNVELAMGSLDDRAGVHVALEQIAGATRRASELTRQMLAYAGRASLRREVLDVRTAIADVVALARAAHSKKVVFQVAPAPEPLWVEIDPAQLTQIVLNLLTNAAEAIGDAAGRVRISAANSGSPPDDGSPRGAPHQASWVLLTVEDTGEGMSEEVRRRMFEPFFSTKASGRGLGLSAVGGIVRSSGGALRLQSEVGEGTRFDVYLPAAKAPLAARGASAERVGIERRGTVLVVDDEAALRRICRRAFETQGFDVIEAADGLDGVARFRDHRDELTLVMLDLTMPGMGGAEVLGVIRVEHPSLPVVIASGYDQSDSHAAIANDARTRFLQKPFTMKVLGRAVAELLG